MEIKRMWYSDSPMPWWKVAVGFIAWYVMAGVVTMALLVALALLFWLFTGPQVFYGEP